MNQYTITREGANAGTKTTIVADRFEHDGYVAKFWVQNELVASIANAAEVHLDPSGKHQDFSTMDTHGKCCKTPETNDPKQFQD